MIRALIVFLTFAANMAEAQTLRFPSNATLQREVSRAVESYEMPLGIWAAGGVPMRSVEGQIIKQAWRIDAVSLTTLQLLRPLREQLRNARYQINFECQTEACGGFDFRFGVETLPPPQMQINIGDFRFLAAERRGQDGPEFISLFVSKTAQAGFVQVVQVLPLGATSALATTQSTPLRAVDAGEDRPLADRLDDSGRAVLQDLAFETGSAQLAASSYASLDALSDYLRAQPDLTVALVGHTDASGGLDANIALSKQRAASVLERLVSNYGIPRRQLDAQGVGYLAPLASNQTEDGRNLNRRVEVVVTSTRD